MPLYKQPKRKFHDAWAFVLFLIATLVANFIYITAPKEQRAQSFILNYRILTYCTIYFISCCFISNILLLTIPEILMHVSFICLPVICIIFAFLSNNPVGIALSLVFGILSLISYFFVRTHIKYSSVICKAATRIINQYIVTVPLAIISFGLIIAQTIFTVLNLKTNDYLIYLVGLLQMYWTYFAILYFVRVFVSSIVSLHVFDKTGNIEGNGRRSNIRNSMSDRSRESVRDRNNGNNFNSSSKNVRDNYYDTDNANVNRINVTLLSLTNTLFSLGPICFGSLLVAIISVLQHIQDDSRDRERGTGSAILYIIVGFLLAILKEIIEYANSWAYIYIAIYGTNYTKGLKGAYELVIKKNNKIFVNNLCIMTVLNFLSLFCSITYSAGLYYIYKDGISSMDLRNVIVVGICGLIFLAGYLSMFDSAGKAFLFAYDCDKEEVMKKYPKEYEAMEEQLRKTSGY